MELRTYRSDIIVLIEQFSSINIYDSSLLKKVFLKVKAKPEKKKFEVWLKRKAISYWLIWQSSEASFVQKLNRNKNSKKSQKQNDDQKEFD